MDVKFGEFIFINIIRDSSYYLIMFKYMNF